MDNYEISKERAREFYLKQGRPGPEHITFLGQPYHIHRQTGTISRENGTPAAFGEVLSIYDLLCHQGGSKTVTGVFAPVNSLKGLPPGAGVAADFYSRTAAVFDRSPETFSRACLELGGEPVDLGDLGFRFPVFGPLSVILKFYRGDEEFPASVTLLWEENMLQFVFYETVFYIAGCLLEQLREQMRRIPGDNCIKSPQPFV